MSHFLVGDIGGTNARFGLATAEGGEVFGIETFSGSEFPTLSEAVKKYLRSAQCTVPPKKACFAVASPITSDQVHLTNSHWSFSIRELQRQLGLEQLCMINDFEAVARSIPVLSEGDKFRIGTANEVDGLPKSVLGAGTGLGMAVLVPHKGSYIPLPTEGGHASFSPVTDKEFAVKKHLQTKLGFVSNETLLSGSGLILLYNTLSQINGGIALDLSIQDLADHALNGTDKFAMESFQMFFEILGAVAGDYALQTGSKGGVYIGGGIAPRYLNFIAESGFRRRFEDKGRFSAYMKDVGTYIITAPQPGLIGAAAVLDNEGDAS